MLRRHMYQVANLRELLRLRGRRLRVGRNVVLLGLVSLFTDISSEMVAAILPLYLVYTLGFSPLQFGVVDGLQQGAAAIVRVLGGFLADRTRRHKEVADPPIRRGHSRTRATSRDTRQRPLSKRSGSSSIWRTRVQRNVVYEGKTSWPTRGPNVDWTIGSTMRSGVELGRESPCK